MMMAYTNSNLVNYKKLSPKYTAGRKYALTRITPHCVVAQWTCERIAREFYSSGRSASCNYGIGYDGKVSLIVEEKNRAWTSNSSDNDNRAITIEVASDTTHPYAFKKAAWDKLVELCVDICRRNGKKKLLWLGSKSKTLAYKPKADEMVLTAHRWFANKACPGDWMYSREGELAANVTARLNGYGPAASPQPAPAAPTSSGKTLGEIAKEVMAGKWGNGATRKKKLQAAGYDYNMVQNYVNAMLKGQVTGKTITYTVQRGDTLGSIAKRYGTTVSKIAKENNISDVNRIRVAQILKITL